MENIKIKCINILRTSLVTFRVWINPYANEWHAQIWKWQYYSKLQHQKTLAQDFSGSSPHILFSLQAWQKLFDMCAVLCALTELNGQYSVDTSDWIRAGACLRVCHSLLTIQQLPLNFLWIQLLNPTGKYNHNDILQKVNKKLLLFLSRTEKELVCQYYASSLITAWHNSVPTKGVSLLLF